MNNSQAQYGSYRKPAWAPPSWVFGPVWTILYVLIAISYGYVAYRYFTQHIPFVVFLPFLLNLVFNLAYSPLQFSLRSLKLALVDVLLLLGTLIWALIVIHPYSAWITYVNIPYLLWVCFATALQATVTWLNRK